MIDLAFVEDSRWQVVDFKSDGDVRANRAAYERQLRWYLHAVTTVTGLPATGTLLQV